MKKNQIPIILFILLTISINIGSYSLITNWKVGKTLTFINEKEQVELTRAEIDKNVIVIPNRTYYKVYSINKEYVKNFPFPKTILDTIKIDIVSTES